MTTLKPGSRKKIKINFSDLLPSTDGKTAYEFTIKEDTQNVFIELDNLNADYDLCLSPSENATRTRLKFNSIYANSTNFGTNRELIFAQLPEGTYFLNIKQIDSLRFLT